MENNEPLFNVETEEELQPLNTETKEKKEKISFKKILKTKLHWLTITAIVVDLCAVFCFFLAYSNSSMSIEFRNWLVPTALGTSRHRYLAYVLYDEEKVQEVVASNTFTMPQGVTDASQISFVDYSNITEFDNPYDEQILTKDPGNDDYKIIPIRENGYAGYMAVIYHPENLDIKMAKRNYGDYPSVISSWYGALVATNASGFTFDEVTRYNLPDSDIISGFELTASHNRPGYYVGMNGDGVLMLKFGVYDDVKDMNYKWAVQFGPFLILNGEAAQIEGNGGYGIEPRTAIGQRADGIVLLLVIDGRGFNGSIGAGMDDLIDIFTRYGCVNAANLDGGGSSTMCVNSVVINSPCDLQKAQERYNVCALLLMPD